MTVEQIDRQIEELKAKKKNALLKEKQKKALEERKRNAKKRQIENRVKYIVGGHVLSVQPEYVQKLLTSDKLREQDKKTLQDYASLIK